MNDHVSKHCAMVTGICDILVFMALKQGICTYMYIHVPTVLCASLYLSSNLSLLSEGRQLINKYTVCVPFLASITCNPNTSAQNTVIATKVKHYFL